MASTDAVTTEHEDQGVLACARIREHHFQDVLHEVFLFAWKSMCVLNTVSCANTVCMYAYDPHRFPLCFTKTHTGPCPSRIHTNACTQVRVCGQILSMQDSYIIWVGTAKPSFANLDVAMCSNMDSMPITSTLLGNTTEGFPLSRSLRTQTVV
jgi:hypothetical protein